MRTRRQKATRSVSYVYHSQQRQAKYLENKLKSIKARNEYLLTLEATNSSVFKYYIHDLPDLIDVSMEVSGCDRLQPAPTHSESVCASFA